MAAAEQCGTVAGRVRPPTGGRATRPSVGPCGPSRTDRLAAEGSSTVAIDVCGLYSGGRCNRQGVSVLAASRECAAVMWVAGHNMTMSWTKCQPRNDSRRWLVTAPCREYGVLLVTVLVRCERNLFARQGADVAGAYGATSAYPLYSMESDSIVKLHKRAFLAA